MTMMTQTLIKRTYTELSKLTTFEERFEYLKLGGRVGDATFGSDRYHNQRFYQTSIEWKRVRDRIIFRDLGLDLGIGYDITGPIHIHHMNPLTLDDIRCSTDNLFNPEYLICCSLNTHNAIHYGSYTLKDKPIANRTPNDMCPWRE